MTKENNNNANKIVFCVLYGESPDVASPTIGSQIFGFTYPSQIISGKIILPSPRTMIDRKIKKTAVNSNLLNLKKIIRSISLIFEINHSSSEIARGS
jgi:hypothetical protein